MLPWGRLISPPFPALAHTGVGGALVTCCAVLCCREMGEPEARSYSWLMATILPPPKCKVTRLHCVLHNHTHHVMYSTVWILVKGPWEIGPSLLLEPAVPRLVSLDCRLDDPVYAPRNTPYAPQPLREGDVGNLENLSAYMRRAWLDHVQVWWQNQESMSDLLCFSCWLSAIYIL